MAVDAFEPGDERVGSYSFTQLLDMNVAFCQRVEAAFATGQESPLAARRTVRIL